MPIRGKRQNQEATAEAKGRGREARGKPPGPARTYKTNFPAASGKFRKAVVAELWPLNKNHDLFKAREAWRRIRQQAARALLQVTRGHHKSA